MNETDPLSMYEAIHEEIKQSLAEIDALVFAYYPYFDYKNMEYKHHALISMLDQMMKLKCSVETVKKSVYSQIESQSTIAQSHPL